MDNWALIKRQQKVKFEGGGLVLFQEVSQAMAVEKALKTAGYILRLVAPHLNTQGVRPCCRNNLVEQTGIERLLKEKDLAYVSIDPIKVKTAPLLDVVR